jgi:hypothetical protein
MLQAMTTGHDGSLSTGHANSPKDMLRRLETMVLMTGYQMPLRAIREQIASAVDLIVHTARLKDGSRKIVNITEVYGIEDDEILTQDIFAFEQTAFREGRIEGELRSCPSSSGTGSRCLRVNSGSRPRTRLDRARSASRRLAGATARARKSSTPPRCRSVGAELSRLAGWSMSPRSARSTARPVRS